MSSALARYVSQFAPLIDRTLEQRLPLSPLEGAERLNEALRYAMLSGGKRMRPVLALLAGELCGAPAARVLPAACGVEYLHASSLIFDDLPSMDDAILRRSRPCLHVAHGEASAILAALALMNEAYAIFAATPLLVERATFEIGACGMIGGQAADVSGAASRSRLRKTTALTRLTMAAGACVAGAHARDIELLASFGEALGEAYQICDDIADRTGADSDLGKTSGQDRRHSRYSTVDQLGIAACSAGVEELIDCWCRRLRARFASSEHLSILEEFARSIPASAFTVPERLNAAPYPAGCSGRDCRADRLERDLLAGAPQS